MDCSYKGLYPDLSDISLMQEQFQLVKHEQSSLCERFEIPTQQKSMLDLAQHAVHRKPAITDGCDAGCAGHSTKVMQRSVLSQAQVAINKVVYLSSLHNKPALRTSSCALSCSQIEKLPGLWVVYVLVTSDIVMPGCFAKYAHHIPAVPASLLGLPHGKAWLDLKQAQTGWKGAVELIVLRDRCYSNKLCNSFKGLHPSIH